MQRARVSLLKQSSLAAVIALPEIMNRGWILAAQTFRPIEVLTLVALIYFALTWPLVLLAAALEKRSAWPSAATRSVAIERMVRNAEQCSA